MSCQSEGVVSIGGQSGTALASDLAAIDASFGALVGEEAFARARDERTDYLARPF
jgi:hypothetical protein